MSPPSQKAAAPLLSPPSSSSSSSSGYFNITTHQIGGQHVREYAMTSKNRQEDVFRLAVNQYVPVPVSVLGIGTGTGATVVEDANRDADADDGADDGAVTVLAFHGNGFPKETYEALFEDLCKSLHARGGVRVRSIWIADVSNQGASGVLNENILGDQVGFFDHSRDVLHMVNHFRADMPRPIIGLAHSYGCAQLVHLSTLHPRLLSTVILIEPIIFDPADHPVNTDINPVAMSSIRRDIWPSREVAAKGFRKAFSFWDPRSLEAFITHGLRQVPTALYKPTTNVTSRETDGDRITPSWQQSETRKQEPVTADSVTLTTTKAQECWTFVQVNNFPPTYDPASAEDRRWNRLLRPDQNPDTDWSLAMTRPEVAMVMRELPHLRPSCLYVFGGRSGTCPPIGQDQKMAVTGTGQGGSGGAPENQVKKAVIDKGTHLLPFEQRSLPALVEACAGWIKEWHTKWTVDEKSMQEFLNRTEHRSSDMQALRLSDEFVAEIQNEWGTLRPAPVKEDSTKSKL